jgi:hypothetical protein
MKTFMIQTFGMLCVIALSNSVASAATITSGSIVTDLTAPTGGSDDGSTSFGGSSSSTVQVQTSPTVIKFVGDVLLSTNGGGSSFNNTLEVEGSAELEAGDTFSLAYDFSAEVVGGGDLTLRTTALTNFVGENGTLAETLTSTESVSGPGTFSFSLADLPVTATEAVAGTWIGQLSFDWENAPANSSLRITIPGNSIDFIVTSATAVPEPGSLALGFAVTAFAVSQRRRSKSLKQS